MPYIKNVEAFHQTTIKFADNNSVRVHKTCHDFVSQLAYTQCYPYIGLIFSNIGNLFRWVTVYCQCCLYVGETLAKLCNVSPISVNIRVVVTILLQIFYKKKKLSRGPLTKEMTCSANFTRDYLFKKIALFKNKIKQIFTKRKNLSRGSLTNKKQVMFNADVMSVAIKIAFFRTLTLPLSQQNLS